MQLENSINKQEEIFSEESKNNFVNEHQEQNLKELSEYKQEKNHCIDIPLKGPIEDSRLSEEEEKLQILKHT